MVCYKMKLPSDNTCKSFNNYFYEYTKEILTIQMEKLKENCDGYLSLDTYGNVYKIYYLASPKCSNSQRNRYFDIGDKNSQIEILDIIKSLQSGKSVVFMNGNVQTYFKMYNVKGDWYINRSCIVEQ